MNPVNNFTGTAPWLFTAARRPFNRLLTGLLVLLALVARASPPRLVVGQPAPAFSTTDVLGRTVSLEGMRGNRVLLTFMRDAGCPICNLRLAQLTAKADSLRAANVRVVLVYESDASTVRQLLAGRDLPFFYIADPEGELYERYGVEKSVLKTLKGFTKGAGKKIKAGKKLQEQQEEISRGDAVLTRITADFLLDEDLTVHQAYYGKYLGDYLPL